MAAFIGFTVPGPAQLSSQMHLPGSGSQITLYSSLSKQASACETISCLSPRKRLIFRAVAWPFLLLGLLQWGRLSQWGPVNADNISTLFLALFIRQRLICMQWLAFPAVFLAGLWRILWWVPRNPLFDSFSQSHKSCNTPKQPQALSNRV